MEARIFAEMQNNSTSQILTRLGFSSLNPMQEAFRDAAAQNKEVILLGNTGSGKTLAFLLAVTDRISPGQKGTQAMIIVPTRELALQTEDVFRKMGTGIRATCCYGGHKREIEENNLLDAPTLIIGTPGRLGDHIRRGSIVTDRIETLVLDEFDKSLEAGFHEEIAFLFSQLPALRMKILTSATEAVELPDFLDLKAPARLNFLNGESVNGNLEVTVYQSGEKDKIEALYDLLCTIGARRTVIFCNHRDAVERTHALLKEKGIVSVFYHGAMEQAEREMALFRFRSGAADFLVTTDLASRGLDIPFVRFIIHYHLPATEDVFIHRNGRTARMEESGTAVVLVGPEEELPEFVAADTPAFKTLEGAPLPEKPKWGVLYFSAGKKDKVNKVDIVGFLAQKGQLKKDDIGLIEVKDFFAFAAVRKNRINITLTNIRNEKIKGRKIRIDLAK